MKSAKVANRVIIALFGIGLLMFSGCAKLYNLDQSVSFGQKSFILHSKDQDYLLGAICQESKCRFSLLDSLGSPIVDRTYQDGKFINSKFLPPNSDYDRFFFEIIKNPSLLDLRIDDFVLKAIQDD